MPGPRPQRDHYAVLGVPRSASARQITSAYRRLVRSLHPDSRPEDPAAAQDLAAVLAAYDTLRDPERRAAYDARRDRPAPSTTAGRPVAVRVTRTTWISPARPTAPMPLRPERPGLLDAPEVLLFRDDRSFAGWVMRQWLGQTDVWP